MSNIKLIDKASSFAKKCHQNQKRLSGEPYFTHCQSVVNILKTEWKINDENILCAAYLHDTIEDTEVTVDELTQKFNADIASLVEGVTKLKSDHDTIKKLIKISYLNPRVALIKLADRLHNTRTLDKMPPQKIIPKATETQRIYTRLAESLGMWAVKIELEDLSFSLLQNQLYEKTKEQIDQDLRISPNFLSFIVSNLQHTLKEANIKAKIDIRQNGYRALFKKREQWAISGMSKPDSFADINDLVSFRILTETLPDCYLALEAVHKSFGSSVDYQKYDEFIGANAQLNGYQAIQTTLSFPEGPVEIAITTKDYEEFNNWGIVSIIHQKHKDLTDYVFKLVFTPTFGVRFLPKNATGIDYAYSINPQLAATMTSILVDNQECSPSTILPNSATVEIVAGPPRRAPDVDFLKYCLASTQKIIQKQLVGALRDELIKKGQEKMETILSPRGFLLLTDIGDITNSILYRLSCQGYNDFYSKVGGGYITSEVINQELDIANLTKKKQKISTIRLSGADKPGILYDLVSLINKFQKNITNIFLSNKDEEFYLRILVKNLSKTEENKIKQFLGRDQRFSDWLLV